MIWCCVICYVFVALTLKSLLSHINFAHSRSPNFRLVCGIDGCTKEYRVYNSFWYHIRRTHSQYLDGLGNVRSRSHRRERSASEPRRTVNSNNLWAYNVSRPLAVDTQYTRNSRNSSDSETTLGSNVDLQPSLADPVEHFGDFDAFDTGETVFAGLSSNSVLQSPQNPDPQDVTLPNETSDSNPSLLGPNRPSDDSCSSRLPQETTNDELSSDDVLSRHATSIVMTAREKHHLSQSGVNDVVAAVQEYQAQLLNSLRSQLQTCQMFSTVCFDRDYMSYKIEVPNLAEATELVNADNLVDFTPYYSFSHRDITYVPMKYYLGDVIELHKASNV
ncbi:unnamed protein product [Leuciscus chuanchicus]